MCFIANNRGKLKNTNLNIDPADESACFVFHLSPLNTITLTGLAPFVPQTTALSYSQTSLLIARSRYRSAVHVP